MLRNARNDITFIMTDYSNKRYGTRTHEMMKDVLFHPEAGAPDVHYHMVRGGKDLRNITIWEPGKVGNEYIKTYGHYHVGNIEETYWIIYGEGITIAQKRVVGADGEPIDDEIEEIRIVRVKAGDAVFMPQGWAHAAVNIGDTFFVTADDSPVNFEDVDPSSLPGHADYEPIKKMRGMAYYIVEENGQPTLVKNPTYKKIPEAQIENWDPSFSPKA